MDDKEEELNQFIQTHKIINMQKEFTTHANQSFWCISIEYVRENTKEKSSSLPKKVSEKKDYKEILSAEDFPVFCELRKWRNAYAEEKGIKSFEILTNDQLAEVVEKRLATLDGLCKIKGFGDAHKHKYGKLICSKMNEVLNKNASNHAQPNGK